jgi:hypothetical protein
MNSFESATHFKGGVPRILPANGRIYPCSLTRAIGEHGSFCRHVCLNVMDVIEKRFKEEELQTLLLKN